MVPVVPTVARKRQGLEELQERKIWQMACNKRDRQFQIRYSPEIERAVAKLEPFLQEMLGTEANTAGWPLRLLDGDPVIRDSLAKNLGSRSVAASS